MKAYLLVLATSAPIFLPASVALAHKSISDNTSHFHVLESSTNLVGIIVLGVICVAALVHFNNNKNRV